MFFLTPIFLKIVVHLHGFRFPPGTPFQCFTSRLICKRFSWLIFHAMRGIDTFIPFPFFLHFSSRRESESVSLSTTRESNWAGMRRKESGWKSELLQFPCVTCHLHSGNDEETWMCYYFVALAAKWMEKNLVRCIFPLLIKFRILRTATSF